jgi:hypothetical protein
MVHSAPATRSQSEENSPNVARRSSIQDISVSNQEEEGETEIIKELDTISIVSDDGKRISVEIQQAKQKYYFHRAIFYSSRIISRQGFRGKKDGHRCVFHNWRRIF